MTRPIPQLGRLGLPPALVLSAPEFAGLGGPLTTHPEALVARLAQVRLVVTDVDGTLTDGGVYVGPGGEALKKFSLRDGMGIDLWRRAGGGRETVFCTRERSEIVSARAAKLQVEVWAGATDKAAVLRAALRARNLPPEAAAYVGDDVNDLGAMGVAGLSFCPSDAAPPVRESATVILSRRGGDSCVRQAMDLLLACQLTREQYHALVASLTGPPGARSAPREPGSIP
ncbi:MAG: HAD hydrolase family protein [Planctomycetes bacterium]|nr:HAD hydrolase family protein [Planctomycetota bacterium]